MYVITEPVDSHRRKLEKAASSRPGNNRPLNAERDQNKKPFNIAGIKY